MPPTSLAHKSKSWVFRLASVHSIWVRSKNHQHNKCCNQCPQIIYLVLNPRVQVNMPRLSHYRLSNETQFFRKHTMNKFLKSVWKTIAWGRQSPCAAGRPSFFSSNLRIAVATTFVVSMWALTLTIIFFRFPSRKRWLCAQSAGRRIVRLWNWSIFKFTSSCWWWQS